MKTFLALVTSLFITTVFAAAQPVVNQASLAPIVQKVMPSVASIIVKKEIPLAAQLAQQQKANPTMPEIETPESMVLGTGVVIDAQQGLLVTNAHIVKNAKQIIISFKNGQHYFGHLIGESDDFDLAIVKINAKNLSEITFADSDKVKPGDYVVAIGNPFGFMQTVTSGIVSALHRDQSWMSGFQDFIQTDAPINPGNSGGPLLNMDGQLIGVNTAIISTAKNPSNLGIGFAIPSNAVKSIAEQLIKYGNVKTGMIGVIAQNLTPDLQTALKLENTKGCVVTQVVIDSPAAHAGIQPEDIITAIDGKSITSADQLRATLILLRPGSHVELTALRNHKPITFHATMTDPDKTNTKQRPRLLAGLTLQDFSELESDGTLIKGIGVANVDENSEAQLAGLMPGDIIIAANQKPTSTIADLLKIAGNNNQLLLKIVRGNGKLFIVLQKQ